MEFANQINLMFMSVHEEKNRTTICCMLKPFNTKRGLASYPTGGTAYSFSFSVPNLFDKHYLNPIGDTKAAGKWYTY